MKDPVAALLSNRTWAIHRAALNELHARLTAGVAPESLSLTLPADRDTDAPGYNLVDGVAIIPIRGTLMKDAPGWLTAWGWGTDTSEALQAVRDATADRAAKSILIDIDSPGGEVSGIQELGDAIYAARAVKPVHAQIEDFAASAAYWVASQAGTVSANQTASVGSIGVFVVIDDASEEFKEFGVERLVVKSGEHKGTGIYGTPVTPKQLTPIQEQVNGLADLFIAAIARGRGMDDAAVRELATGRTWLADQAQAHGLIDSVENADAAFDRVCAEVSGMPARLESSAVNPASQTGKESEMLSTRKPAAPAAEAATDTGAAPNTTPNEEAVADADALDVTVIESEAVAIDGTVEHTDPGEATAAAVAQLTEYVKAFGAEAGAGYFAAGLSMGDAALKHLEAAQAAAAAKDAEIAELKATAAAMAGEAAPVTAGDAAAAAPVDAKKAAAVGANVARIADGYDKKIAKRAK